MKTNQVLTRTMGPYDVLQRTCDGYFDANALLYQWNKLDGNTRRRMDDFLKSNSTNEFMATIINRESQRRNFATPDIQVVIKGKIKTNKNGSKNPASIWMHPFLFIDFAMWINAEFKYDVIKFVYDELIKYRNDAGDAYKEMTLSISKIVDKPKLKESIIIIIQGINAIIFGRHDTGIRNHADEKKMIELYELEKEVSKLINKGFIKSYDELIKYLRQEYIERQGDNNLIK